MNTLCRLRAIAPVPLVAALGCASTVAPRDASIRDIVPTDDILAIADTGSGEVGMDAGMDAGVVVDVPGDTPGDTPGDVAGDGTFATDGVTDVGTGVAPPRLIAPLSTARVTRTSPTLRWALAPGTDGAIVEVCTDRACSHGAVQTLRVHGTRAPLPTALAPGIYFWRARGTLGRVDGTDRSPTWEFRAPRINGVADTSFDSVPDWDGDGLADFAIGEGNSNNDTAAVVHVYLSRNGVGTAVPSVTFAVPNLSLVANIGDIDGDGYADLAVRTIGSGHPERVDIHPGGPAGPSPTARYVITWPAGNTFGVPVAALGDVNGDGYGDFAAGNPGDFGFEGRIDVYHGGPAGPVIAPADEITGGTEYTGIGMLSPVGDVDGDGYADVAVEDTPGYFMGGGLFPGDIRVFHGGAGGIETTTPTYLRSPEPYDGGFGNLVVGPVDLNADGYPDVVVAAQRTNPYPIADAGSLPGRVYAYSGSPSFVGTTPSAVCHPDDWGGDVTTGDFDADGYDDLVLTHDQPTLVQIVRGSTSWLPATASGSFILSGELSARFAPVTGRDLDGDGTDDLIGGVASVDTSGIPTAFGYVVIRGVRGTLPDATTAVRVLVPGTSEMYAMQVVAMLSTRPSHRWM